MLRNGKQKFWLRPDVAIRHGKQISILIDTKWKLLDPAKPHEGVRQSDMYQAYAYAREFDCPCVILLYPRFGNLDQRVADYRMQPGDVASPRVEIKTVDVTQSAGQVRHELNGIVRATVGTLPR